VHIAQRGHSREPVFLVDGDYRADLDRLGKSAERIDCAVHADALMTNHIHMLATPRKSDSMPHDATRRTALRALHQPPRRQQWQHLGRAVKSIAHPRRAIPTHLHVLYRTQPGASEHDCWAGAISLEQKGI